MGKGEYLKYTNEQIMTKLKSKGFIWIDGEYKNRESEITVETLEGYKILLKVGSAMSEKNARPFSKHNPYTIANIRKWIIDNDFEYKLLSEEFNGRAGKLTFYCEEHGEFQMSFANLLRGCKCAKCSNNVKYTLEEVKQLVHNVNPNLTILSKEYEGVFKPLNFKCNIDGYEWTSSLHNILKSKANNGCPECKKERFRGSNNHNYNPNLTEEERRLKRTYLGENYTNWKVQVFERDNRTCDCCGYKGKEINAHHLDGYNWCKEKRVDVENGVTLCVECHNKFHKIYGKGYNTKEQYFEFKNEEKFRVS